MPTHYLATTSDGRVVSRKSTRNDFTHAAAMKVPGTYGSLPNFSTSRDGAAKLFESGWREVPAYEVVELRIVDAAAYRAATRGINPKTGLPKA